MKCHDMSQAEAARNSVRNVHDAMEKYRTLMSSTMEQRVTTVIKYGSVLSEVRRFVSGGSYVLRCSKDEPICESGIFYRQGHVRGMAEVVFRCLC